MKNKIKVCLIGAGRAGIIHGTNFKNAVPHSELVAIVEPNDEIALNACKKLEISNYFSDVESAVRSCDFDAAIIVTPTIYHNYLATKIANAGKHILCEKPMAINEQECEQMITAARSNGVKLQIGFMRRFDTSFLMAKSAVDRGDIGEVVLIKSLTRGPSKPQEWMYDIRKSNGPLAEVNSHDIDTVRWFSGSEIKSVYAVAGNYRSKSIAQDYPDFYDNVIANGLLANGAQFSIEGAQYVKYGYDARVEILGTDGVIFLGRKENDSFLICNKEKNIVQSFTNSWTDLYKDAYLAEDIHFINCILEDKAPDVSGLDGKMAVKVVNACNKSILGKCAVELDDNF